MGAKNSKSDREMYSKEEVEKMLERQRRLLEQQQKLDQAIKEGKASVKLSLKAAQACFERDRPQGQQINQAIKESTAAAQQTRVKAAQASFERDRPQPQQINQTIKESTAAAQQARVKASQAGFERDRPQPQQINQTIKECTAAAQQARVKAAQAGFEGDRPQPQQINQTIKESTAAAQQTRVKAAQARFERDRPQLQQINQTIKESTAAAQQARVKAAQAGFERDRSPISFKAEKKHVPNKRVPIIGHLLPFPKTISKLAWLDRARQACVPTWAPLLQLLHRVIATHTVQMDLPRSQNRSDSNDELNCPTCHQKYTLNSYQCDSGNLCGKCGCFIGNVRNRSLKVRSYIVERKVSCPNSQDGCQLVFKMAELEAHPSSFIIPFDEPLAHQKKCPFKEMMCPLAAIFGQCLWRGKLPQISKHFEAVHPIHCTGEVNRELTVTQTQQQIVYLVVMGPFNFLFNLRVSETDRKFYLTVQLIGTKYSAEKWSYEVHIYNKKRKYQYKDICHSNSTPLDEIFSTEQCATLPFSYADTFVNRNLLTYKFFIKKDVERRPRNEGQGGVRSRYEKS